MYVIGELLTDHGPVSQFDGKLKDVKNITCKKNYKHERGGEGLKTSRGWPVPGKLEVECKKRILGYVGLPELLL